MNIETLLQSTLNWLMTEGVRVVVSLLLFWLFCKILDVLTRKTENRIHTDKVDANVRHLLAVWLRRIIKFLVFVCLLGYWGIQTTGISAAIASVGLTIGLALQGSLSNLAGGVLIIVLHPFHVGDYVDIEGVSGTVVDIELFNTTLTTPDNKQIIIPNGVCSNQTVINYSRLPTRRNDLVFSISYSEDHNRAKAVILSVMEENEKILQEPAPFVNIKEHGANSIDILARYWTQSSDFWEVHWYMLEKVKEAFDTNGIEIPYPQLDLHVRDGVLTVEQPKGGPDAG